MELRSGVRRSTLGAMALALFGLGCEGTDGATKFAAMQCALGGVTAANLQLQVSKNACAGNMAQDYFKVTTRRGLRAPVADLDQVLGQRHERGYRPRRSGTAAA